MTAVHGSGIRIRPETILSLETLYEEGTGRLDISPEIQRRSVWEHWKQVKLIDSLLRNLPIGGITIYLPPKARTEGQQFEVIDGKQRLTAIFNYMSMPDPDPQANPNLLGYSLDSELIQKNEDSELVDINDSLVKPYLDKRFTTLHKNLQDTFRDYEIPVTYVQGDRAKAAQVFTRMNSNMAILNEQEIRNAIFRKEEFLPCVEEMVEKFRIHTKADHSGLISLGATTIRKHNRMQGTQIMSELLIYALEGTQHRHDGINDYYRKYRTSTGTKAKDRGTKAGKVGTVLERIWKMTGQRSLANGLLMKLTPAEEQLYALVAALIKANVSKANFDRYYQDMGFLISDLMVDVALYQGQVKTNIPAPTGLMPEAVSYYNTFSSQINSRTNRETRIEILKDQIKLVAPSKVGKGFEQWQKDYTWAANVRKNGGTAKCERTNCLAAARDVESEEYHCGHKVSDANEGHPLLENAQVEHKNCNLTAQDRKDS